MSAKLPSGFHVQRNQADDTYGLSAEEIAEERAAKGKRKDGRGGFHAPAVKNPFDEILRTIGLYERVQKLCHEHGVAPHEIALDSKSQRLHTARKKVYQMLKDIGWSNVDIGKLLDKDPSTIRAALK